MTPVGTTAQPRSKPARLRRTRGSAAEPPPARVRHGDERVPRLCPHDPHGPLRGPDLPLDGCAYVYLPHIGYYECFNPVS